MADWARIAHADMSGVIVRRWARYRDGFKYCRGCELWFKTDRIRCPFCNRVLKQEAPALRVDPKKYLGRGWEKHVMKVNVRKKEEVVDVNQPSERCNTPT